MSAPPTNKPSICFVARNAYAVISGRTDLGHIGGAEVQQALIARELVRRGYPVRFVTLDHGQPDGIEHDGIRVHKMYTKQAGLPGLRFISPRWTGMHKALTRANCDICYQRAAGAETGQVAFWCRRNRRRFLYAAAGDPDCDRSLWRVKTWRERLLYKYGLFRADPVIVQTAHQQNLLSESFGLHSELIRSCAADPGIESVNPPNFAEPRLVWLGRITRQKALDHVLAFAQLCPEIQFDLVGDSNAHSDYARDIIARAEQLPNIHLHGRVPHSQVSRYYEQALALLCTSDWEGFPNTFVEAWSRGRPVVTRWDGDNLVNTHDLGLYSQDVEALAAQTRRLIQQPDIWHRHSQAARNHYQQTHSIKAAVDAYERVFLRS
jgi:glycosyltransferase involved in cell wall biosynthesis